VRAISLDEGHLVGKAYGRMDDLEGLLRYGVSAASGDAEWLEENVLADIRAAMIVGRLARQRISDPYEELVRPRLLP
jgi:hypothetical protein